MLKGLLNTIHSFILSSISVRRSILTLYLFLIQFVHLTYYLPCLSWDCFIVLPENQRIINCNNTIPMVKEMNILTSSKCQVRMAERSKALRSGRSLVFQAWVRIPLLTNEFFHKIYINHKKSLSWVSNRAIFPVLNPSCFWERNVTDPTEELLLWTKGPHGNHCI